jgi:hypothetical protein
MHLHLSPSLLKVVATWVFILHFMPFCEVLCMGDGVDKFRVLVEVMFCFELIRDMTMRLLLVKFEQ